MDFNSRHELGRYNPGLIKKLISSANEILNNLVYVILIKPTYEKHVKNMALTYQATHELLRQHYVNNPNNRLILKNEFLSNMKSFKSTTGIWCEKSWTNNQKWAGGWINETTEENPNNCLICNYRNSYYRYTNYDKSLDF